MGTFAGRMKKSKGPVQGVSTATGKGGYKGFGGGAAVMGKSRMRSAAAARMKRGGFGR